jgi:hypothetical protein
MQVMNDDVSPTLREQMKHHEPIVCYSVGSYEGGAARCLPYQDKVGALCGTDDKWIQQQQEMQGKLIVECLTKK